MVIAEHQGLKSIPVLKRLPECWSFSWRFYDDYTKTYIESRLQAVSFFEKALRYSKAYVYHFFNSKQQRLPAASFLPAQDCIKVPATASVSGFCRKLRSGGNFFAFGPGFAPLDLGPVLRRCEGSKHACGEPVSVFPADMV